MIEQWRPVVGFEAIYEVSDLGRLRRIRRSRGARLDPILRGTPTTKGYLRTVLHDGSHAKDVLIHNVVLRAFVGDAPGRQCNHKNGIKTDNRLVNLEWVTALENTRHAIRLGLFQRTRGHA